MNVTYMGIDPGLNGGVGVVNPEGRLVHCDIMPLIGKEIDVREIRKLRRAFGVTHVIIEKQHSMPQQGVASTFKIGLNYGMLLGAVNVLGLPSRIVTAGKWQATMLAGLPRKDKTKESSAVASARLWPFMNWKKSDHPSCKKPHDGKTDAALIAEYGRRTHQ